MKTKFDSVYFTKAYENPGFVKWYCHTNIDNTTIGIIFFDDNSKQHSYMAYNATRYLSVVLNDISNFITILDNQ